MQRPAHLFLSSIGGNLFDTRDSDWNAKPPLRAGFASHSQAIKTTAQLKACLRAGAFSDLGGYPLYFFAYDGESLSFEAVRDNLRNVLDSIMTGSCDGWRVVGCDINYEDSEMVCAHTGKPIPSAYGDDDDSEEGESA